MADHPPGDSVQRSHDGLTEEELNTLIVAAKIKRETAELHARFPAHLAELASRIRVRQPTEQTTTSQSDGCYGSSFTTWKTKTFFSVFDHSAVDGNNDDSEEPFAKSLTLTCVHWSISHNYRSGLAGSETVSLRVEYGGMEAKKAFVTDYGDPGIGIVEFSHGGVGDVLKSLLAELGGCGDSSPCNELELVDMLLSDKVKVQLDTEVEGCGSLRKVIEGKLEDFIDDD